MAVEALKGIGETGLPSLTGEPPLPVLEWLVAHVSSTILGEVRLCLTDPFGRVKADNGRCQVGHQKGQSGYCSQTGWRKCCCLTFDRLSGLQCIAECGICLRDLKISTDVASISMQH